MRPEESTKTFRVCIPRKDREVNGNPILRGKIWYTRRLQRRGGGWSGAGVYYGTRRRRIALGRRGTIFQEEVQAILRCAETLIEKKVAGRQNKICSKSQATLTAVENASITSELIWERSKALSQLS